MTIFVVLGLIGVLTVDPTASKFGYLPMGAYFFLMSGLCFCSYMWTEQLAIFRVVVFLITHTLYPFHKGMVLVAGYLLCFGGIACVSTIVS